MTRVSVDQSDWDVVVIGAGAAGLLAAFRAAQRGCKTLLLEKNRKIGVKILISGGTRCNITHNTDAKGIILAFGRQGRFLHSALAALDPTSLVGLLHQMGVPTKIESTGKVFPVSDRAIDVRDALVRLVDQTCCKVMTETPVVDVLPDPTGFCVQLTRSRLTTRNVIITTGGMSYPGCGTVGDGYAWAERFGHSIVKPIPGLVPVVIGPEWPRQLQGVTIDDARLIVVRGHKQVVEKSRASFLFTHFGFSGPSPMNVSRALGRYPVGELRFDCDFWPADHFDALRSKVLEQRQRNPRRSMGSVFMPELSRRFVDQVLRNAGIEPQQKCAETSHKDLTRAIRLLKELRFPVQGTRGFQKAEVTAGGVDLDEVNSSTMQSKLKSGLYLAGEILDLDGPIGGYNFQSAFSTGWLAGTKVAVDKP